MNAITKIEPDKVAIDQGFYDMLIESKALVAQHALAAWDGETVDEINGNLKAANSLLSNLSDRACKLGYLELGTAAIHCKNQITAHLEGDYADLAICPGEIIWFADVFIDACDSLIN